jgi:hypothetical protein
VGLESKFCLAAPVWLDAEPIAWNGLALDDCAEFGREPFVRREDA